ncbi:MAG: hypothetical protein II059_11090 [Clostridia bacterium]|nr:hypothetical protein [Clostridia bacterium]
MKNFFKILLLNLGIALLNVILFSKGLVGLTFTGGAVTTALAVTAVVMSLIAFGYGNYTLLFSEPKTQPVKFLKGTEFSTSKEYIDALSDAKGKNVFDECIDNAIEQVYRMDDKDKALDSILEQFFEPQEITFTRFQNAIDSVKAIFFNNIKKMINRMMIFDYKDYKKLVQKIHYSRNVNGVGVNSKAVGDQLKIYNEHISYVYGLVEMNENVLTKLDKLLLEISKLDDLDEQGLENIAAIQEINDLIAQTKYYKV